MVGEEFFKEEYILNNAIGQTRHGSITCERPEAGSFTRRSADFLLNVFCHSGCYKKPYVALIDGITMGGVSVVTSNSMEVIKFFYMFCES